MTATSQIVLALRSLKLSGMANTLEQQFAGSGWRETAFEERLEHLITEERSLRHQRKVSRLISSSGINENAIPENFWYHVDRGIDPSTVRSLLRCEWITSSKRNLLFTGATGIGKTWIPHTFGHAAARLELKVAYFRVGDLLESLELSRHDGMRIEKMNKVRSMDLLILDDLGLNPLTHNAVVDLLTILDDRVGRRSTIVSAQMPVDDWHEYLGGGAVADAIMDRLIHTSDRYDLNGKSLRSQAWKIQTSASEAD
jgi:DNA replication protein DnaC